jgi:threonylcarbamoyladenosine tRNA methylthiotransferase MtaB
LDLTTYSFFLRLLRAETCELHEHPEKRCYYSMVATFYVQNFGCRATQADGAAIERQLKERGLEQTSASGDAQIVVLNTCTVTASADQDARAAIRRVHRENPNAQIVVTGCYAQRSPEELASLPGVTQVIGNSHKHRLAEIALTNICEGENESATTATDFVAAEVLTSGREGQRPTTDDGRQVFVSDIFAHTELLAAPVFEAANERTRPNLKIQDGCDNRCSFCVIPFVRGQSRSMKVEQIIGEVNTLVAAGYRELVISGINLGRWGKDLQGGVRFPVFGFRETEARTPDFVSLIRAILDATSLEKLRISSVEPMDWSAALISLVAESPRIAKHAHVPMQSGSDAVLRRMHRRYRPWHYREKIEKIRVAMPTAAIGADVMVGFPGETDAEFEETRRMIEDLPFTYLHVFTYSARPGTPAASMPRQVPVQIARERNRILRELGMRKKQVFMESFVGKTVDAITLAGESKVSRAEVASNGAHGHERYTECLTDNYLPLRLRGRWKANQWLPVRVDDVEDKTLIGTLMNSCSDEA